jgi:CRISPR-associated protein Cas1
LSLEGLELDYGEKHKLSKKAIERLEEYKRKIRALEAERIPDVASLLRGWEGVSAKIYYESVNLFLPERYRFSQRTQHPAMDIANSLLNYGYAILRAVVARALVGSGLLPTLGIHHHNRYNAYCLADDVMEPYRPYVDELVIKVFEKYGCGCEELIKEIKAELLIIPMIDVVINGKRSPLMIGVSQTTASLQKCFAGDLRKISYPEIEM